MVERAEQAAGEYSSRTHPSPLTALPTEVREKNEYFAMVKPFCGEAEEQNSPAPFLSGFQA